MDRGIQLEEVDLERSRMEDENGNGDGSQAPSEESNVDSVAIGIEGAPSSVHSEISPPPTATDHVQMNLEGNWHKQLFIAALKGNWQSVETILPDPRNRRRALFEARFSHRKLTALHVAAMEGKSDFVEKFVHNMPREAVVLPDGQRNTALHYAAIDGNLRSVTALVSGNRDAKQMMGESNYTPLLCAACFTNEEEVSETKKAERKDVIQHLIAVATDDELGRPFGHGDETVAVELIGLLNRSSLYDISLRLFNDDRFPAATDKKCLIAALEELARNPQDFRGGSSFTRWERCIYSFPCSKNVRNAKSRHQSAEALLKLVCEKLKGIDYQELKREPKLPKALVLAAEYGTVEVIKVCLQSIPEMIWDASEILETAVRHRREKVVNLFNKASARNKMLTNMSTHYKRNLLHWTAGLAPLPQLQSVPGSAFQLQRELQWFKEMEKLLHPLYRRQKNDKRKTPWQAFLWYHKRLISEAEKWMTSTSQQCMVVSALVTGAVFSAAMNVPGGFQDDQGFPVLLGKKSFILFAISDAAALFSSIIAILMFLSILTSRFAPEDFLKSLPMRMIIGLASLFFSIAAMMVAFGATLTIVLRDTWTWIAAPVTLLASLPVIMFVRLQLPLFAQMVCSTAGSGIFHPEDIWEIDPKEEM